MIIGTDNMISEIYANFSVVRLEKKYRLDKFLSIIFSEISRNKFQEIIKNGGITIDGIVQYDQSIFVQNSNCIEVVVYKTNQQKILADPSVNFQIVYEDQDVLVIDKPSGLVVHPGAGNYEKTLVHGLVNHCGEHLSSDNVRPGIVHRIDKDTSGILVIAKNDFAAEKLGTQFAQHTIVRRYVCFCHNVPLIKAGIIKNRIGRDPTNRQKMKVLQIGGKESITNYKCVQIYKTKEYVACKMLCELQTGRTHQVRLHMLSIGIPLIGEVTYTKKDKFCKSEFLNNFPRQALHAEFLSFSHPRTEKSLEFFSPLPDDMQKLQQFFISEKS